MKTVRVLVVVVAALLLSRPAFAAPQAFAPGSLIIPMDIDSQDAGMLRAFGLVYKLLLADVPVAWSILPGKSLYTGSTKNPASPGSSVDFTATAKDVRTGASVGTRGYRGGPFIIGSDAEARALPIITAWNNGQTNLVTVHEATAGFTAPVDRVMLNAPNIGINADGNEAIAYGYLNAAGIPDSSGKTWSGTSPDVMTPAQVAGPTTSSHRDGKLWGPTGQPRYCQLMSMHWTVSRDTTSNEAIAEMSEYLLHYPVHLFAECQAVNQLEDAAAGHFVSTDNGTGTPTKSVACDTTTTPNNGLCAKKPTPAPPLEFLNSDLAFAQMDGPFKPVGGSEPSYGLAPGSSYYDQGIVMIREANVANGMNGRSDLWMTGYANFAGGVCNIDSESSVSCASRGKVSYLGGHQYATAVPISTNGETQGTRLFLNSLFEAACVTAEGSPNVSVGLGGPTSTTTPLLTYTFDWLNIGAGVAVTVRLVDTLPPGASFVSATGGGAFASGQVTWDLGDLPTGMRGSVSVTVALSAYGSYQNSGTVTYKAGNNVRTSASNTLTTMYGPTMPAGTGGSGGGSLCAGVTCPGPAPANPCKVGACNAADGTCGLANVGDGTPCDDGNACTAGTTCTAGTCGGGAALQCGQSTNPCKAMACVPASGCVMSDVANGTPCASGNKCATDETCTAGTCGGGATRTCPAPASPCEVETCDPASGCGFAPGHEGATCDDGDVCTTSTICRSGLCQGGAGCGAPSQRCTLVVCGTTGCLTTFAVAGTDPGGDCPAIGACARSCNGSGSCTSCPGGAGGGGGGGASGAGGTSNGMGGAGGGSGVGGGGGVAGTGAAGGRPASGGSGGQAGQLDGGVPDGGGATGGNGGSGTHDGGTTSDSAPADHSSTGTSASDGCNCNTAGVTSGPLSSAILAIGLALAAALRRRPGRARASTAPGRTRGEAGDHRA